MSTRIGVRAGPLWISRSIRSNGGLRTAIRYLVPVALALALLPYLVPVAIGLVAAYWVVWRPVVAVQRRRGIEAWTITDIWRNG